MGSKAAILVSPGAVDGYPPVQNQAILLARSGFDVHVLTNLVETSETSPKFSHEGVTCHTPPLRGPGKANAVRRLAEQIVALSRLRWRLRNQKCVEIAYDPLGLLYSDQALFRPALRIAHLHEGLQRMDRKTHEARLLTAIMDYALVVTPDESRSNATQKQLGLKTCPTVVCNYPLATGFGEHVKKQPDSNFEVVYCGAVGTNQSLDEVIRSMPLWDDNASFRIYGNEKTAIGDQLKALAREVGVEHRVHFGGWVQMSKLPELMAKADLGICLQKAIKNYTALGASNKRYQYMQAGLAQIGDMIPGVAEMLEGDQIGLSVRSFEPQAIADAVNAYAADPDRTRREGKRAYLLFKSRYNYETAFAPVLEFIETKIAAMP